MATAPEQNISVTTSRIAAPMVAEVESQLPILMHANKAVQKATETAGNGTTMDVIVPEMPEVGDGAWINEGDATGASSKAHELDFHNRAVSVVLKQWHVAFGIPSGLEFASISDMANQVVKPYGSTLASKVQTEVADKLLNESAFSLVLNSADMWPSVSEAIANIRKARAYGYLYGVVGSTLNGKLAGSGIKYFNPTAQISDIWKSARLGEYNGAEWFSTADVTDLIVPNTSAAAGSTSVTITEGAHNIVKGGRLFNSSADALWVTSAATVASGAVTAGGWVKGEIFTISGVNAADIFGNDLGVAYSFKVLDTKIESGNLLIKIANPAYGEAFYNGGDATISSVTKVTSAGTYYRGVVYAESALCVAFGRFAKVIGAESKVYSGQNGITARMTSDYQVEYDRTVTRFDCLVGSAVARKNWACELLVKAS